MKKSLGIFLFSVVSPLGYANEINRTPEQNEIKIAPVVKQAESTQPAVQATTLPSAEVKREVVQYTGRELVENPALLESLLVEALVSANRELLQGYVKIYPLVSNADHSLLDWANAILLRDKDLNDSVSAYRSLITKFPENNFIRFQLAETLFYNQEFDAAKTQFEKLRSANQNTKDIAVFDHFLNLIDSKEHWDFSFGASFLNDKNLTNSTKVGTTATLPGGAKVTYSTPRQSGQGLSAWMGADKRWNIQDGYYFKLSSSMAGKYYWDNKYYNDFNASFGLGVGYSDARFKIEFIPTVQKRWYAGGISSGKSLKQYIDTYGASVSSDYWLAQKWKYSFYYDYGYEKYRDPIYKRQYNGANHTLINSIMYQPTATQYWALSLDLMHKNAKDKTNAYNRIGSRITWGSELPFGVSTSSTLGMAKRYYKEASFFGVKQKNKEYSASVSLWHKELHYAGFTPRVTYSYTKTDSNIPIYSYDKHQVLFNIGKSF